jgi:3-(3-hydroxy-phenyl)propionate hydroxylase
MTMPARVWELLSPWLTESDADIVRAVVYRFHATVATAMRSGPVFLAGDAAHQMPPFLGQGLCSGVRDAANLAWKLQMVAAGQAGDTLLDTYDTERRPHAAGVVAHAVDTGRLIDQLAGRGGEQQSLDSAYGGQRPFPRLEAGFLAGDGPLTGRQMANVALLTGGRLDSMVADGFAVVVDDPERFTGAALDRWRALDAAVVHSTALAPFGIEGAIVVRPDRYVASLSADPAQFEQHTHQLMEHLA